MPVTHQQQLIVVEVTVTDPDTPSGDRDPQTAVLPLTETTALPAGNPGARVGVIRFAGADVVVQRRAVEVIHDRRQQLLLPRFLPTGDATALLVEPPLAVCGSDPPAIRLLAQGDGSGRSRQGKGGRQSELLTGDLVIRLRPEGGLWLHDGQIEPGQ